MFRNHVLEKMKLFQLQISDARPAEVTQLHARIKDNFLKEFFFGGLRDCRKTPQALVRLGDAIN